MLSRLHRWWLPATSAVLCAYAAMPVFITNRIVLAALGDSALTLLVAAMMAGCIVCATTTTGQTRLFWALLAFGSGMWAINEGFWVLNEAILLKPIPDPSWSDAVLFLHIVPFIAAVALRPHRRNEGPKLYLTLNFLMLLAWWVFLYAFIVVPDQFIRPDANLYSRNFNFLYLSENLVLVAVLGLLAALTRGSWRRIYWNFFVGASLYMLSSLAIDEAIRHGKYYTGSLYDVPFVAAVCWMIRIPLLAQELQPEHDEGKENQRLLALSPRLAMVAVLSLPILAFWTALFSHEGQSLRHFRLFLTFGAMLGLGMFIFVRQFLLDRELVRLLKASERNLENMQRLQSQLVQKEKLAALGEMLAVAAHDINVPLESLLSYAHLADSSSALTEQQQSWVKKIVQLADRTRDLVASMLSFTQQATGEKSAVQVGMILSRALHMQALTFQNHKIRVESSIPSNLPPVMGNANKLLECFLEIIGNAQDAVEEQGGGTFWVSGSHAGGEVILEFRDSGRGIADPKRVFDPFYTTKPIGKGTGLGLSATYGVMQDHQGQITCHNAPQGGAVFVMRFPVAAQDEPAVTATAARA